MQASRFRDEELLQTIRKRTNSILNSNVDMSLEEITVYALPHASGNESNTCSGFYQFIYGVHASFALSRSHIENVWHITMQYCGLPSTLLKDSSNTEVTTGSIRRSCKREECT